MFRGQQIAHPELGRAVVQRVAVALADVSKIETDARLEGEGPDDDPNAEIDEIRYAENEDSQGREKRFCHLEGESAPDEGLQEPHPYQEDLEAEAPAPPSHDGGHRWRCAAHQAPASGPGVYPCHAYDRMSRD